MQPNEAVKDVTFLARTRKLRPGELSDVLEVTQLAVLSPGLSPQPRPYPSRSPTWGRKCASVPRVAAELLKHTDSQTALPEMLGRGHHSTLRDFRGDSAGKRPQSSCELCRVDSVPTHPQSFVSLKFASR